MSSQLLSEREPGSFTDERHDGGDDPDGQKDEGHQDALELDLVEGRLCATVGRELGVLELLQQELDREAAGLDLVELEVEDLEVWRLFLECPRSLCLGSREQNYGHQLLLLILISKPRQAFAG